MYQAERESRILEFLSAVRIASPAQIQSITGASIATVRRDLNQMARKGLIHRSHGYAQLADAPASAPPARFEEKMRIARIAADQVRDGDVIRWVYTCDLGADVGGGQAAGDGQQEGAST